MLGRISEEEVSKNATEHDVRPGSQGSQNKPDIRREDLEAAKDDESNFSNNDLRDNLLRRPSLEYTVGNSVSGTGKHRVGRQGKESDLEAVDLAPARRTKEVVFAVSSNLNEDEDAIFACKPRRTTVVHSQMGSSKQRVLLTSSPSRGNSFRNAGLKKEDVVRNLNDPTLKDTQYESHDKAAAKSKSSELITPGQTGQQREIGSSSAGSEPKSSMKKQQTKKHVTKLQKSPPQSSRVRNIQKEQSRRTINRPQTAGVRREQLATSHQQYRPPSALASRRELDIRQIRYHPEQSGRVSPQERLRQKQLNGVNNLRTRVRPNVQERIRELDEQSAKRWDVTSQLDYEMRLSQGVGVVSKNHQIGWIWETVEDERTCRRRAANRDDITTKQRERRARCSTTCATLYPK